MPDVLKIATERRAALLKEIAALDRFIETAHSLLAAHAAKEGSAVTTLNSSGKLKPTPAATPSAAKPADSETEAFLKARDVQVARTATVAPDATRQSLANLARN